MWLEELGLFLSANIARKDTNNRALCHNLSGQAMLLIADRKYS